MNPRNPQSNPQLKDLMAAVERRSGIIIPVHVQDRQELEGSFAELQQANADALIVFADPLLFAARNQIAALAIRHRLPTIYSIREHVESGGLVSYAINRRDSFYHAATLVHKILKGAKPGDLPIELPTKLELVVNLTTAKSMGITIPEAFLV